MVVIGPRDAAHLGLRRPVGDRQVMDDMDDTPVETTPERPR
jgi:hypothetical protein